MGERGGRYPQESTSLLLHPARVHEGCGRLPQVSDPYVLSSESITTVPCAPPGSSVLPPGAQSAGTSRAPLRSDL